MPAEPTSATPRQGEDPSPATRWDIVAIALAAGIITGFQVGKVPPALPALRADLGLDLVTAGWVASIFNATGAVLGVAIGLLTDRMGPRRVLIGCISLLGLGSLLGGLAPGGTALLAARFLEGVGSIGTTVAAPKIIAAATRTSDHGRAFGIWGTYMPVGMALSMVAAPTLLTAWGWRGLWLINAAMIALFLVLLAWSIQPRRWPVAYAGSADFDWVGARATLTRSSPWLFGLCFGVYTVQWSAMMAWLPTFLIETLGHSTARASSLAALVVFANAIGNLAAAWAMHRGVPRWLLITLAFAAMGAAASGVFAADTPPAWKIPLALAFSTVGGLLPASVFAGAAAHAATASQVALASGFAIQGANLGSLVGPPTMALAVGAAGGWHGSSGLMLGAAVAGLILVFRIKLVDAHR